MMLIKGNTDDLEIKELRIFDYGLLVDELGQFENYRKYHGAECEEVLIKEFIDGVEVVEYGWQIVGTSRIVEVQWTKPQANT